MDQVVAADRESIAVAGDHPDHQVGSCTLEARCNRGGAAQAVGLAQAVTDKARVDAQEHEKAPIFGGWPDPWAQKKNHRAIGCAFCEAAIARDGPKTQSHNEKGGLNIG